jgi:hypothetical protein
VNVGRLGQIIYWFACGAAILVVALGLLLGSEGDGRTAALLIGIAAISWFLGFAMRRVLD